MAGPNHTVLTAIPPAPGWISTKELKALTGMTGRTAITGVVHRLSKRGLITKVGLGRYRRTVAGDQVVAAGVVLRPGPMRPGIDAAGEDKPYDHLLRGGHSLCDRAWGALRMLRKATAPELLELAVKDEKAPASLLYKYLGRLVAYGIVVKLERKLPGIASSSNGFSQWTLIRDLGPKAPVWRTRTRQLLDRNSGKPIPLPGSGL